MWLSSPVFGNGRAMPRRCTDDGCNHSPPIYWHDVPAGAAELALIVEDLDAQRNAPSVHWLVYKIPADSDGLPAGVPPNEQLTTPPGAFQGVNDFSERRLGYRGPAPPRDDGGHRYRFRVLAVDEPVHLGPGETRDTLLRAVAGRVIAEAEAYTCYERI